MSNFPMYWPPAGNLVPRLSPTSAGRAWEEAILLVQTIPPSSMFTYFTDKSFVIGHMYDMRVCRKCMFRLDLWLPISMLTCHNNVHVHQAVMFLRFKHVTTVQYTSPLCDKHWPTLRKVVYESLFFFVKMRFRLCNIFILYKIFIGDSQGNAQMLPI